MISLLRLLNVCSCEQAPALMQVLSAELHMQEATCTHVWLYSPVDVAAPRVMQHVSFHSRLTYSCQGIQHPQAHVHHDRTQRHSQLQAERAEMLSARLVMKQSNACK